MTSVRERRNQEALRLTLPQIEGIFMNSSSSSSSLSLSLSSSSLASSSSSGSPANIDTLPNLDKLSVLGSGGGGIVYKVSHKQIGAIYALKVVRFGENDVRLIPAVREAEILQRVNSSEYVVKCLGVFNDGGDGFSFLMEYMNAGSLHDILCRDRRLSEKAIFRIVRSVLKGLKYLHGHGIVHRDIKPSNVLVNTRGEVKIADFGASRVVANADGDQYSCECTCTRDDACRGSCTNENNDGDRYKYTCTCTDMITRGDQIMKIANSRTRGNEYACTCTQDDVFKGTTAYMSPERMDPEKWDGKQCDGYAGDIWSLGVVAMECYMGRFPFVGEDEKFDWATLMCAVCLGENVGSSLLERASPEFESFCRRCLERDWRKRGTLEELLLHPFVHQYDDGGGEDLLKLFD